MAGVGGGNFKTTAKHHKMVVLEFLWATDPGNPLLLLALFNSPRLKSLINNVAKFALFIKFDECSFHKMKAKLSKYCHIGLNTQSTFA